MGAGNCAIAEVASRQKAPSMACAIFLGKNGTPLRRRLNIVFCWRII
jgi:hypothetical protein